MSSVTGEEIYHGLEKDTNPGAHCLCFIRNLKNINHEHPKAWRFLDQLPDGKLDTEAEERRNQLRETVNRVLPQKNIHWYVTINILLLILY